MRHHRSRSLLSLAVALLVPAVAEAQAGNESLDGYFRAVGEHFRVSSEEVRILSEWRLSPEEVPVVLFLSRKGGISPDAVVALKRGGRSWGDLCSRYSVGGDDFHVPMEAAHAGPLARVYELYRSQPSADWSGIELTDDEIVALVNVRLLSDALSVPPARVVEAYGRTGSFPATYRSLAGGG